MLIGDLKFCWGYNKLDDAIEMLEKALILDPNNSSLLGDAANTYAIKAEAIGSESKLDRNHFFEKAESLFKKADSKNAKSGLYVQWAKLAYYQKDCNKCLAKIALAKELAAKQKGAGFWLSMSINAMSVNIRT